MLSQTQLWYSWNQWLLCSTIRSTGMHISPLSCGRKFKWTSPCSIFEGAPFLQIFAVSSHLQKIWCPKKKILLFFLYSNKLKKLNMYKKFPWKTRVYLHVFWIQNVRICTHKVQYFTKMKLYFMDVLVDHTCPYHAWWKFHHRCTFRWPLRTGCLHNANQPPDNHRPSIPWTGIPHLSEPDHHGQRYVQKIVSSWGPFACWWNVSFLW